MPPRVAMSFLPVRRKYHRSKTTCNKVYIWVCNCLLKAMGDEDLPVPAQLETQLGKCKTVRKASEYYRSREKTSEVRTCMAATFPHFHNCSLTSYITFLVVFTGNQSLQIKASSSSSCCKVIYITVGHHYCRSGLVNYCNCFFYLR